MQAPLSNTASGPNSHPEPFRARTTLLPHRREHALTAGSLASETQRQVLLEAPPDGRGLAHDAGNLLGALGLYCELLASPGVLRDEHRHYAEELQLLSARSRDLIKRLLDPATTGRKDVTASTGEVIVGVEQVVVPDVIEGCRGLLNAVARRAIAVAYGAGAALPVAVSREALERILVNLTKNAAEAMAADLQGTIIVRVICEHQEGQARRIVLTVEDTGRGMSSAAVKVLMAPTLSGNKNKADPRSGKADLRGIGFQVVRELVGASGGQLRLKSQNEGSGCGTTVEVTWSVALARHDLIHRIGAHPLAVVLKGKQITQMTSARAESKNLAATRRISC